MKLASWSQAVLIVASMVAIAASAPLQAAELTPADLQVDVSRLNAQWFQALELIHKEQIQEANLKLVDVNLQKYRVGFANLTDYSAILLQEAAQFRQQGRLDEASSLIDAAQMLSPDLADGYFALARVRFAQNFMDVYAVIRAYWGGLTRKYSDITILVTLANNAASVVFVAGLVASVCFLVFSFLYYQRAVFYQFKERLPFELPILIAQTLGWVFLGVLTLGLGVAWGVLVVALLLLAHVELAAKRVLQAILGFAVLMGGFLIVIGVTASTFDGAYFQTLATLARQEFSSKTAPVLLARLQAVPNDPYAQFGLAYLAQKTGHGEKAVALYTAMWAQYADAHIVQNNLANTYQAFYRKTNHAGWYTRAEEAYFNAINAAPKAFAPHYNLGKLLLLDMQKSQDANNELASARKNDPRQFKMFSDLLGESETVTVDQSFSTLALLKKLFDRESFAAGLQIAKNIWGNWSRFDNPLYFSVAAVVVFVLSFSIGAKKGQLKQGVIYCQMCGDPYTVKLKKSQEPQTLCTQCTYIFKKKAVVKPEKREAKIKQIQLRQHVRQLLARIASVCFPGAGQVYFGYPFKGILIAVSFYLALGTYLLKDIWRVMLASPGSLGISWSTLIVAAVAALGVYVFNLYDILTLSPKNQ